MISWFSMSQNGSLMEQMYHRTMLAIRNRTPGSDFTNIENVFDLDFIAGHSGACHNPSIH